MLKTIKGLMGSFKVVDKPQGEYTHLTLTIDEYNSLVNENESLGNKIRQQENFYLNKNRELKITCTEQIKQLESKHSNRVNSLELKKKEITLERDKYKGLNKTLISICTERANAKRKITPKKQCSGFMFLTMRETVYNNLACWSVTIQTPYCIDFNNIEVKGLVDQFFFDEHRELLKINRIYTESELNNLSDYNRVWEQDTIVFKVRYTSNIVRGFWEINFLTNKEMVVPDTMRKNLLQLQETSHKEEIEELKKEINKLKGKKEKVE